MTDTLGYRKKFAVIVPSTNTVVQPEMEDMRPHGVTNHVSRIAIRDIPVGSSDDAVQVLDMISKAQDAALDSALSCQPDHMVLGISAESFWGGLEAARKREAEIASYTGLRVSNGASAIVRALERYKAKRIAAVTPFWPVSDEQLKRYLTEAGFDVARIKGLRAKSPVLIAHIPESEVSAAMLEVNGDDIDAILQMGTNLPCARLAAQAELWLGKPVIAVNTAIYWDALRTSGIEDRLHGFGSLMSEH